MLGCCLSFVYMSLMIFVVVKYKNAIKDFPYSVELLIFENCIITALKLKIFISSVTFLD